MRPFFRILLWIFLFTISTDLLGNIPNEFNNVLLILSGCIVPLLYYRQDKSQKQRVIYLLFSIVSIIILACITFHLKIYVVCLYVYVLYLLSHSDNDHSKELKPLLLTSFILVIYSLFLAYNPSVFYFVEGISFYVSKVVSLLLSNQHTGARGSSYTGISILIIMLIYIISLLILSDKKNIMFFVKSFLILILSFILFNLFQSFVLYHVIEHFPTWFYTCIHCQFMVILFFMPCIWYIIKNDKLIPPGKVAFPKKVNLRIIAATLFLLISCFSLTFSYTRIKNKGTIYLFKRGNINWDLPVYNKYGPYSAGMFGVLPGFLKAMNFGVTEDSTINASQLAKSNVLVLINADRIFSKNDKKEIWAFVNNGGSLLVLGDHTGDEVIRKPFNDLLTPVGIRFNFDCGVPFIDHWTRGIEFRPHYITQNVSDDIDAHIGVGATLQTSMFSNPVVIGKFGYSDKGDKQNFRNGFLGNMLFSIDENAGNLVLVAESRYGRGRVLVFGDNSPFQNTDIIQSHQFVTDVFTYLSNRTFGIQFKYLLSLLLLITGLVILLAKDDFSPFLAFIIAGFFVIGQINKSINKHSSIMELNAKTALIDKSHMGRFNVDLWDQDGLGGISLNLMRNTYLPFMMKEFDVKLILKSRILLIIAPEKPYSSEEIGLIENWVRNGGTAIICSGWSDQNPVRRLLDRFNLGIYNIPLGSISSEKAPGISMQSAWPVYSKEGTAETLCRFLNYPVVIYKTYNKGGVILIGDSRYLLNNNVESIPTYNISNIRFIKMCLDKIKNK